VCCSVLQWLLLLLQCGAVCCTRLQHTQHTVTMPKCMCLFANSWLQCVAVRVAKLCNTLNALQQCMSTYVCSRTHVCGVLQCAAVCCSVCCRVLQCVAVGGLCRSVLHHTAHHSIVATLHSSHATIHEYIYMSRTHV